MSEEMKKIDPRSFIGKATITYQYADYEDDTWTVPVSLTGKALQDVYDDLSITKIRIYPNNSTVVYELDVK